MPLDYHLAVHVLTTIAVYVTAVWLLSLARKDAGIMDVFWGPGFLLATGVAAWAGTGAPPRVRLVLVLVGLWAVRLAWHIFRRNHGQPEDARYARWRREAGEAWWWRSWFKVFALQGVIMWAVSAPLLAAVSHPVPATLTVWDLAGAAVFIFGLVFEAVADAQLAAFKRDSTRRGRVFDGGLWRYSRHPNYFGESVIWVGVALIALSLPGGWMLFFGPALMIWLIVRVSGVRMLDDLLTETKPGYADYVRKTRAFIPGPPRG